MTFSRIARACLLALLASSCAAHRYLVITSEPAGAQVEIDGQKAGQTPLELEFQHYGARQITVSYPGHSTWSRVVRIKAPWYGRFPLDFVTEILLPIGWVDRHEVHAALAPQEGQVADPDLQAVLARARALRATMEGTPPPKPVEPVPSPVVPPSGELAPDVSPDDPPSAEGPIDPGGMQQSSDGDGGR